MAALDQISRWPVQHAAAMVIGPTGVLEAVGEAHRTFALASVTKLLAAMATLVAVEEESVSLDEPAGPAGSTVRHLLAHASGLAFAGGAVAPPGARRVYSNTGYDVLGSHVERATGVAFPDYLAEAVFEPLAMTASTLGGSPAHSATSTVADLTHFTNQLFAPTLLGPSTLALAMTVAFPGLHGVLPGVGPQRPLDWGLGFEVRGHKSPHWTAAAGSPHTVRPLRRGRHLPLVRPRGAPRLHLPDRQAVRRRHPSALASVERRHPRRARLAVLRNGPHDLLTRCGPEGAHAASASRSPSGEWARPGPPDLDLDVLLRFAAFPFLHVATDYEAVTLAQDYAELPWWLAEDYPELFHHPAQFDRIRLYSIAWDVRESWRTRHRCRSARCTAATPTTGWSSCCVASATSTA